MRWNISLNNVVTEEYRSLLFRSSQIGITDGGKIRICALYCA
jgi:hypothetical protein